jgi:hypothetical protein
MRTFILILASILVIVILCPLVLRAQDASINANVDKRVVGQNEELTLTVEVKSSSGGVPEPQIPSMSDFQITGQYTSSSQSISITNGSMQRTVSKIYTLNLLPTKTGQLTVPPILINYQGREIKSNPIQIEVTQGGGRRPPPPPQQRRQMQQNPFDLFDRESEDEEDNNSNNNNNNSSGEDVYLKASTDKNKVYVGEQFLFSLGLYRKDNMPGLQGQFSKMPTFSGFKKTDIEPVDKRVSIGGTIYDVREWNFALIPVMSGEYTIDAAELPCQTDEFSGFFMFRRSGSRRFRLSSDPVKITVLPLPEAGKPDNFSGAVGSFTISASIDKSTVKENEAITLKMSIGGRGDLSSASDPVIPDLPGTTTYKSKSDIKTNVADKSIQSVKNYEYVLVPSASGDYTIGPINFSFFDSNKGSYRTISTNSYKIRVNPGDKKGSEDQPYRGYTNVKQAVTMQNKDINFIRLDVTKLEDHDFSAKDPILWMLNGFPVLLFVGAIVFKKRSLKLQKDIGYARSIRADKFAKKRLDESAKHMKDDSENLFLSMINKAITEFIADKLNISAKGLTLDTFQSNLENTGLDKETLDTIINCLNECDTHRYSQTSSTLSDREKLYNRAKDIMVLLEKHFQGLKRNRKKS